MPEKAEQPAFDPSQLLTKIESLLKANSRSTDQAHRGEGRVGKSWVWSLVLPILVLAAMAVVAWLSQRGSRELAKLRHEKFAANLEKEHAELFVKLDKNDALVEEAQKKIDASKDRLRIINADIAAEDKRHEANMHALHRIRTWDGSYRRIGE